MWNFTTRRFFDLFFFILNLLHYTIFDVVSQVYNCPIMSKKKHTAEDIINKLREAEVLQSKGQSLEEVVRQLGISSVTYYKWRKEYGGLRVDQAKRFKEIEQENQWLRKVVADLTIDNSILKEVARGNF